MGLDLHPNRLVWIEIGRIAGQEVQLQAPARGLDEALNGLGTVGGVSIDDKEYRLPPVAQELGEKAGEDRGVEATRESRVPETAPLIDRRDRVDGLTLTADWDDQGLAAGRPSAAQARVRANPRFVEEEDHRPPLASQ